MSDFGDNLLDDDDDSLFDGLVEDHSDIELASNDGLDEVDEGTGHHELFANAGSARVFSVLRFTEMAGKNLSEGIADSVVIDILDELTGGRVSNTIRVKTMERKLLQLHFFKEVVATVSDTYSPGEDNVSINSALYLNVLNKVTAHAGNNLVGEYQDLCERTGALCQADSIAEGKLYTDSPYELEISKKAPLILRDLTNLDN